MSARLAAEKAELEAVVAYLGQRLFQNAGDAAELRATLAETAKERDAIKAALDGKMKAPPDNSPDNSGHFMGSTFRFRRQDSGAMWVFTPTGGKHGEFRDDDGTLWFVGVDGLSPENPPQYSVDFVGPDAKPADEDWHEADAGDLAATYGQ